MGREDAFYQMGYQNGVEDHDNKLPMDVVIPEKYGSLYIDGYKKGYEDAKSRSWYIVCVAEDYKTIKSYMNGTDTGWGKKDIATKFATRAIVTRRLNDLLNSVGRGSYMISWEKVD